MNRRDLLKTFGGIPVLASLGGAYLFHSSRINKKLREPQNEIVKSWKLKDFSLEMPQQPNDDRLINAGIIGFGWQGTQLAKAMGFVHPNWVEQNTVNGKPNWQIKDFLAQFDLKARIAGICDLYDGNAQKGVVISQGFGPDGKEKFPGAKRYKHYTDLLHDKDIEAVIIATPDFWHATIVKEAIRSGKHIYCEKPMAIDIEDAREIRQMLSESNVTFQLGHQNFQQVSHLRANELIKKNVLGPINLVEFTANRFRVQNANPQFPKNANEKTVDWDAFQEILPVKKPFDLHRYFNWYYFLDYGIGVAGTMLTHEYSAADQILEMGIPASVTSSGGKYVTRFESEIPDVFNTVMEFPDKEYSFLYSITYGNSAPRGRWIMGEDGTMNVGGDVAVYPELRSPKYKDANPLKPIYSFTPGQDIDAVTSASEVYFAKKGLLNTFRYGRQIDTLHLHVKEWLNCIRTGGQTSCHIGHGVNEVVACVAAHKSYMEKKTILLNEI